jgi:hypothetical protein
MLREPLGCGLLVGKRMDSQIWSRQPPGLGHVIRELLQSLKISPRATITPHPTCSTTVSIPLCEKRGDPTDDAALFCKQEALFTRVCLVRHAINGCVLISAISRLARSNP